jgi:IS30 family transposase
MKALHNIAQITSLLGRNESTISRELCRNAGYRGYAVIAKVSNETSNQVGTQAIDALKHFEVRVKTLSHNNGKEFRGQAQIAEALASTGYLALSFASLERGSNENFNGLLRQYLPKKRVMEGITDEEIKIVENRLSSRPRNRLGFITPAEVFHQSISCVALHA